MIQLIGKIKNYRNIGQKAIGLDIIKKQKIKIPDGFVISTDAFKKNQKLAISDFLDDLNTNKFAVRSAALPEDGTANSYAGLFLSKLNVTKQNVIVAIQEVRASGVNKKIIAYSKIKQPPKMSVIIQEMIDFDFAGVIFTCHPITLKNEFIINFAPGDCANVVSGQKHVQEIILPKDKTIKNNIKFFRPETINELLVIAKKLEKIFSGPQDIEFGIKDNKIYILQSRPITATHHKRYWQKEKQRLSALHKDSIIFEKNELAESAPRPTPLTFDIIKKIYSPDGSLGMALKKMSCFFYVLPWRKLNYIDTVYGQIMANKTREKFIFNPFYKKPLFIPLYPYFLFKEFKKLKNIAHLKKHYPTKFYSQTAGSIIVLGQKFKNSNKRNLKSNIDNFIALYHHTFIINTILKIQKKILTKKFTTSEFNKIAGLDCNKTINIKPDIKKILQDMSFRVIHDLELYCDKKIPVIKDQTKNNNQKSINELFKNLPEWQKKYYSQEIATLLIFKQMAQDSKHLFSFAYNNLRIELYRLGEKIELKNPADICFLKLKELLSDHPTQTQSQIIKTRKEKYIALSKKKVPTTIQTGQLFKNKRKIQRSSKSVVGTPVCAGQTSGAILNYNNANKKEVAENTILIVPAITPEILPWLDHISGLIAETGNLLSHGAILAREYGVPTIIIKNATEIFSNGEQVNINCDTGIVTKDK